MNATTPPPPLRRGPPLPVEAPHVGVEAVEVVVRVSVRDDGDGGADATGGSGLVGLKDRVEALGDTISIQSPVGAGTSVEVELPIDD